MGGTGQDRGIFDFKNSRDMRLSSGKFTTNPLASSPLLESQYDWREKARRDSAQIFMELGQMKSKGDRRLPGVPLGIYAGTIDRHWCPKATHRNHISGDAVTRTG